MWRLLSAAVVHLSDGCDASAICELFIAVELGMNPGFVRLKVKWVSGRRLTPAAADSITAVTSARANFDFYCDVLGYFFNSGCDPFTDL